MAATMLKSRIVEIIDNLNPQQQREVMNFAAYIDQQSKISFKDICDARENEHHQIQYDGWAGCLSHTNQSAVELQHLARDNWGKVI